MATQLDRFLMDTLRQNLSILRELAMRHEVSRYRARSVLRGRQIGRPEDAGQLVAPEMEQLVQEQLRVLLVDTKNRLMGQHLVYQGNVNSTQVRAAEVFREAIIEAAPKIILAHNHPSGDPEPSSEDIQITGFLREAGRILNIEVLDHLVVGQDSVISMRARDQARGVTWPSPGGDS